MLPKVTVRPAERVRAASVHSPSRAADSSADSLFAKYPSDTAYSAAMRSALAGITPSIRASGKIAVANIGSWSEYSATGNSWLPFLDGGMDELVV